MLLWTDGPCLEWFLLTADVLDKFQLVFLRRRVMEPSDLVMLLSRVLRIYFYCVLRIGRSASGLER